MEEKVLLLNKINNEETKCSVKGCNNKATVNLSLNSKKCYCYCEKHLNEIKDSFDEEYNNIRGNEKISDKIEISTKDTLYI